MKRNEIELSSEEFPDERSEVVSSLGKIYELMLEMPSDKATESDKTGSASSHFFCAMNIPDESFNPLRPCDAISHNSLRYNDTVITSAHPLMFALKQQAMPWREAEKGSSAKSSLKCEFN